MRGGLSGEKEAEINERSPSQDCETSGSEHRRHRKSSITFRNNNGLTVTSFFFLGETKNVKGMSPKGREIFWSTNACPKLDTGYHYRPSSWDTSGRVPFKNPLFYPPPGNRS